MIDLTLHRPPHACHPTEVRVTERLRTLADSPQPWTVTRVHNAHEIHPLPDGTGCRELIESILARWKKAVLHDPPSILHARRVITDH